MTTNTIERPSKLTEAERADIKKLMEMFEQITDDTDKRIALAYLEGMAAASNPPKVTV